jgi:hypothetical protein
VIDSLDRGQRIHPGSLARVQVHLASGVPQELTPFMSAAISHLGLPGDPVSP